MGGRWRFALVASVVALLAGAAPADGRPAVAFQIDVAHDGHQTARTPRPPLHRVWTRRLTRGKQPGVSYPLIVGQRVFVTAATPGGDYTGTDLLALRARDGQTLWSRHIPGDDHWSALAYDHGRVFAVDSVQHVWAFRARTGARLWDRSYGGLGGAAPPVAAHGRLYVSSDTDYSDNTKRYWTGGLAALRERDGSVRWHHPVGWAGSSAVAIGHRSVYAAYPCPEDFAFRAESGNRLWHRSGDCYGLGGQTPVLHAGRLYVGDGSACRCNEILSAASGRRLGTYTQTILPPAFRGDVGFFGDGLGLHARNLATGRRLWSFQDPDDPLAADPLVVGSVVFDASASGRVWALDARSGKRRWSGRVPGAVTYEDSSELGYPTGGMGAASGMLVVPTEKGYVVAFRGRRRS